MQGNEFWEVAVRWKDPALDPRSRDILRQVPAVLGRLEASGDAVLVTDLYYFRGAGVTEDSLERAAPLVLSDPVTQTYAIRRHGVAGGQGGRGGAAGAAGVRGVPEAGEHEATVLKKPGVMDPVEGSLLEALADLGVGGVGVRTGVRYTFRLGGGAPGRGTNGIVGREEKVRIGEKILSNPAIEDVSWEDDPDPQPFREGTPYRFQYREVPLAGLSDDDLMELSRRGQLSLNLDEMRAIRDHFRSKDRAPSDVELETLAQTWSEHCCHKTLTGTVDHEVPGRGTERIENLLGSTIRRVTDEIAVPWCLSVFVDNAGVIAFDEEYGVTFKVETHNHPSAIEPYGGAGTGIGGVLRDTVGTGLGAKPIVNTDVFCFGPPDLPLDKVPPGALHPLRVLRGVVSGVRDYGNRMGIPTASGAVYFDERYVGNPLVYCGSIGLIPRECVHKEVRPGDRAYVLGGRTGRDGIHGATFSSVELTEESETVSSGAVQIGNAITEKKLFDVILQARDRRLYRAITDCGAGGLSSAVGEMGAETGARVELDRVPLKYEGLSYWEVWISEAQERMVIAVPPENVEALESLARSEDVECTDIGEFTDTRRLVLTWQGHAVCDLDMAFLHDGRPRGVRRSVYQPPETPLASWSPQPNLGRVLRSILSSPNVASKEWIVRQYDHEVQGKSVLKPLQGVDEDGPGDGVAFAPRFGSRRGIVIGCGMNPLHGDIDPYRMALGAVDEAVRNVVAAGGDLERTALLDNFCWGNTDRPEVLGTLVEAARGCRDAALAFRCPFISGKDSLRNEYRVGDQVISIPPSLLISSISVVEDVGALVSVDLKEVGSRLLVVGETREELGGSHFLKVVGGAGGAVPDVLLDQARRIHGAVAELIRGGLVLACHDLSEGGLAVALAEMAFAGNLGAEIHLDRVPRRGCSRDEEVLFSESHSRYLLEVRADRAGEALAALAGLPAADIGQTVRYRILRVLGLEGRPVLAEAIRDLKESWKRTLNLG